MGVAGECYGVVVGVVWVVLRGERRGLEGVRTGYWVIVGGGGDGAGVFEGQ